MNREILAEDDLLELKELARQKVKTKFVKVMRRNIKEYINQLDDSEVKKETINLLSQVKNTLDNVHRLIKNNSIVDANTLLRTSFENLIMGMMINYEANIYNEFLNLSINDQTRKYTKPQYLRNHFRKVLRQVDDELFADISNRNLKEVLDELYNNMCLFTHSTLVVNITIELQKEKLDSVNVFALKQNSYFLEILLYLCLKKLHNSQKQPLDGRFIFIGWIILLMDIDKKILLPENLEKLNQILYKDINKDFFEDSSKKTEKILKDLMNLLSELQASPILISEMLKEILN